MSKKQDPQDDGRTIVDMNVDGFRWYTPKGSANGKSKRKFNNREKKALIRSTYLSVALPIICLIVGGTIAFLILYYFWL